MSSKSLLFFYSLPRTSDETLIKCTQNPEQPPSKCVRLTDIETKPTIKAFVASKYQKRLIVTVLFEETPQLLCYEIDGFNARDASIVTLQPPYPFKLDAEILKESSGKPAEDLIRDSITVLDVDRQVAIVSSDTSVHSLPFHKTWIQSLKLTHDGSVIKRISSENSCFFKITAAGHLYIAGEFFHFCIMACLPDGEQGINDLEGVKVEQPIYDSDSDDDERASLYHRMNFFVHEKIVKTSSRALLSPALFMLTESNKLYAQFYVDATNEGKIPIRQLNIADKKIKDICVARNTLVAVTTAGDVYMYTIGMNLVRILFDKPIAKVFPIKDGLILFAEKNQDFYFHMCTEQLENTLDGHSTDSITSTDAGMKQGDLASYFSSSKWYDIEDVQMYLGIAVMHFKRIAPASLFCTSPSSYADVEIAF